MIFLRKWKNLRLIPSKDLFFFFREHYDFFTNIEKSDIDSKCFFFFREHYDFFTNIEKSDTDSKWRNLKRKLTPEQRSL